MSRVSLKPSTYVEYAGIDDVDVTIGEAMFCYFNYSGDNPIFTLDPNAGDEFKLVLAVQFNEDGKEPGRPQAYSAGDKEFFRPEADGAYLASTGTKQAINSGTNASLFLASVCNAGFPEANLDSEAGVKSLTGTKCHVNQMQQPKRSGNLVRTTAPGSKPFDPDKAKTILLVTRIISLPGAKTPGGAAFPFGKNAPAQPAATTKPTSAFATASSTPPTVPAQSPSNGAVNEQVVALAQETLINILAENGGKLSKKAIPPKAFVALGANPLKGQVVSMIFDDKFLSSVPGIRFDGAEVTMG